MEQTQQTLLVELKALQAENVDKTKPRSFGENFAAQKTEVSALRGVRQELSTPRASGAGRNNRG